MSDTFTGAKGVDIAETNNYIAGLEVGELTTSNLTSLSAGVDRMIDGLRLEAGAGFAIANGLDFGLGSFSWTRIVALDDYTPTGPSPLWSSHVSGNNRVELSVQLDGKFRLTFVNNSGTISNYDLGNPGLTNRQAYRITLVCDRGGNASLFVGGTLKGTVNISSSSSINIGTNNTTASTFWTQSTLSGADGGGAIFNFALPDIASRLRSIDFINPAERWFPIDAIIGSVSDFTSGTDSFSATRGVLTPNSTVAGVSGALKIYKNDANGGSYYNKSSAYTVNTRFTISVDIYIPSSNTNADGFQIKTDNNSQIHYDGRSTQSTAIALNTWTTVLADVTTSDSNDTNNIQISLNDGNSGSWQGLNDANDDVMYIKNFKLLSNGAVLHHRMREGTATTVGDASTNNKNAATTGTVHWL
jgi:hypothetical protein